MADVDLENAASPEAQLEEREREVEQEAVELPEGIEKDLCSVAEVIHNR